MAESFDFGALFDGLLADGADLIAGVAGLEAGRFLSVHKLGLVAECGNGLLSAQDGAADLADSTLGNAGLGAGGSLCLNVHGGVLDHGDLFAFLHDDAAELAYLIAGVADFGAGRFLDIGKLVGCGVCDHRCYFNIRRTISIHEFSAAELAALVGQALMLAGCIIERVKRIAVLAGSCDGDLLACVACSSMAASALFVVNVLKATLEASCLFTLYENIIVAKSFSFCAFFGFYVACGLISPVYCCSNARFFAGSRLCILTIPGIIHTHCANGFAALVVASVALYNIGLTVYALEGFLIKCSKFAIGSVDRKLMRNRLTGLNTNAAVGANHVSGIAFNKVCRVFSINYIQAGFGIKLVSLTFNGCNMLCFLCRLKRNIIAINIFCLGFLSYGNKQFSIAVIGISRLKHFIDFTNTVCICSCIAVKVGKVQQCSCRLLTLEVSCIAAKLADSIAGAGLSAGGSLFDVELTIDVLKCIFDLISAIAEVLIGERLAALLAVAYGKTFVAAACSLDDHGLAGLALPALVP